VPGDQAKTFTDEERDAWFGFLTVHSLIARELDARLGAGHGMPLVEYEVLLKLSLAGGRLRMSELADAALLSRSGLTRIVDELEALELVRREPDENDGRVLVATLTPLGRRQFAAARRTHLANVRKLFLGPLTAEQRRGLGASWQAILEGLGPDAGRRSRRAGQRGAGGRRVTAGRS
jgi:DNA-binding MarR family transcriptional regulator